MAKNEEPRSSFDLKDTFSAILQHKDRDFLPYITQWIDYQANNQNRLKMIHDLELKDGTILEQYRPNADSWYRQSKDTPPGPAIVKDNQVAKIRLSLIQYPWWAE